MDLVLDLAELLHLRETTLAKQLGAASQVRILVPFRYIGNAAWNVDVAWDYLAALYVGEMIAPLCSEAHCAIEWTKSGAQYGHCQFDIRPKDPARLSEVLLWICHEFDHSAETGEVDLEDRKEEVHDAIAEFAGELDERKLQFPVLAEEYSANMVTGLPQVNDDMTEHYESWPEHKHDFWRSHYSNLIGVEFYVSIEDVGAYIIPLGADANFVLRECDAMSSDAPALKSASLLAGKGLSPVVFTDVVMARYPAASLSAAQECARDIWPDRAARLSMAFWLNDNGDVLIVEDGLAQYVIFSPSPNKILDEDARSYLVGAEESLEALRAYLGVPIQMACPWETIDDEKFEQLCYDVVYYCGRYDRTTIRKMGNSRSRDGGRDIEAFSLERRHGKLTKWIFQCKYTRDNRSVAGSKINLSDTVDQYGAGGFCIMTNGTIDATLFDKMDAIARHRDLEVSHWSRFELERFLAQHREIRERYFK